MAIVDIVIVSVIFYQLFLMIEGTRAVQLIKGIFVLLLVSMLSRQLELETLTWLLDKLWTMMLVALPVVFQPELRRALEQIGRGRLLSLRSLRESDKKTHDLINELLRCIKVLSRSRIGALVALEQSTGIQEYADTGVKIDGIVSSEFLVNLFIPKSPLHDGAVIIRGDRVAAAGCFLPLTQNPNLDKNLGTRHRAAIGLSEVCDALVLVVSEETGVISSVQEGKLQRFHDEKSLTDLLHRVLLPPNPSGKSLFRNVNKTRR
ncbi:MAG: diadenylate cyclase CdaA [Gracilibacteraceae bacterium]|nr:diadenylate cyclase CdaA [Gracilibacteraceae bacterium]